MPFKLELHHHVKICLCRSPGLYLESPRRLLLQRLRLTNPHDTLHVVFDSHLFEASERQALVTQLRDFSQAHGIQPFDIRYDLHQADFTSDEQQLFERYEQEITAPNNTGSLETASRLLRLLNAILEKGIFSAENFAFDTANLPAYVSLETPLLLNIELLEIPDKTIPYTLAAISTDLFATADVLAASETLTRLREAMISNYTVNEAQNVYLNAFETTQTAFERTAGHYVPSKQLRRFPSLDFLFTLASYSQGKTPLALRQQTLLESAAADPQRPMILNCIGQYACGDPCTTLAVHPRLFCSTDESTEPLMRSSFKFYALNKVFYPSIAESSKSFGTWDNMAESRMRDYHALLQVMANRMRIDLDSLEELSQINGFLCTTFNLLQTPLVYQLDPHRHVKIWLSNNPDVFMNLENQLRLIKLRDHNPSDKISLIFDSELLSKTSQTDLQVFCQTYSIQTIDVRDHLNTEDVTLEERQLSDIYHDEVTHLNEGGNLGAASDILRWLPFVYKEGIYSDVDIHINTQHLPEHIAVRASLLCNVKLTLEQTADETSPEVVFSEMSNDFIAIVNAEEADESIKHMQRTIIEAYHQPPYKQTMTSLSEDQQNTLNALQQIMTAVGNPSGVRELRNIILSMEKNQLIDLKLAQSLLLLVTTSTSGPLRKGLFPEKKYTAYDLHQNLQWQSYHTYSNLQDVVENRHDLSWTPEGSQLIKQREQIMLFLADSLQIDLTKAIKLPKGLAEFLMLQAEQMVLILSAFTGVLENELERYTEVDVSASWYSFLQPAPEQVKTKRCLERIMTDITEMKYTPKRWSNALQAIVFSSQTTGDKLKQYAGQLTRLDDALHDTYHSIIDPEQSHNP